MELSTTNIFKGKVKEIKEGVIIAKIQIDIGNGLFMTHTVMIDDVVNLAIREGDEVHALVDADSIILVKDLS